MRKAYGLVGAALASLLWVGCDRGGSDNGPSSSTPPLPDTPSSTMAPATAPIGATSRQAPTTSSVAPAEFLSVDNKVVQFTPARIRMESSRDGKSPLLLYSAKPQNRADEETGNSFYFELELDVNGFAELDGASWQFKAPTGERQESPIGIFLDGMRRQLQPYEVLIEFEGAQPPYAVHLNGYFLSFDARDSNLPPERVFVSGTLEASIDR